MAMNPGLCYLCEEPLDVSTDPARRGGREYETMEMYSSGEGDERFMVYTHPRCKKVLQKLIDRGMCADLSHRVKSDV